MRLANGDSFNDKSLIFWSLFSKSLSLYGTYKALSPDLPNMSMNGNEHALVRLGAFEGFLGTAARSLVCFGFDGEGIAGAVVT